MDLLEKKQQLSQGKPKEKIPSPKEEKKDISGFRGKPYLTREEFRGWLRSPEAWKVSGLPEVERIKLEKELFGPEAGYYIERGEPERALKKLREKSYQAKTGTEKAAIEKKIRIIEKFLGK